MGLSCGSWVAGSRSAPDIAAPELALRPTDDGFPEHKPSILPYGGAEVGAGSSAMPFLVRGPMAAGREIPAPFGGIRANVSREEGPNTSLLSCAGGVSGPRPPPKALKSAPMGDRG